MNLRLIARLDVKLQHLIKGVQMEGWRKLGNPAERAKQYYHAGADELIYMDVVASLYARNNLAGIVREVAQEAFVPITVGGGINTLDAVRDLLAVGADKVAINTAATKRPEIISEISDRYGSQATVLSIEAKQRPGGGWEALTDNGRNRTGLDVVEWAAKGAALGAGEILVTSVDRDGTMKGLDLALVQAVADAVNIPVIASGGAGTAPDVAAGWVAGATGIAIAKALHTDALSLADLRGDLPAFRVSVRHHKLEDVADD
jgi:cyclase